MREHTHKCLICKPLYSYQQQNNPDGGLAHAIHDVMHGEGRSRAMKAIYHAGASTDQLQQSAFAETIRKVSRSFHRYDPDKACFYTWLNKLATNATKTILKNEVQHQTRYVGGLDVELLMKAAPPPMTDEEMALALMLEVIWHCKDDELKEWFATELKRLVPDIEEPLAYSPETAKAAPKKKSRTWQQAAKNLGRKSGSAFKRDTKKRAHDYLRREMARLALERGITLEIADADN